MNLEQIFDLFLEGNLKGKELEDFNNKLKDDSSFYRAFEDYKRANKLMHDQHKSMRIVARLKERFALSQKARPIHEMEREVEPYLSSHINDGEEELQLKAHLWQGGNRILMQKKRIRLISAAAGILILIGLPAALLLLRQDQKLSDLFREYYAPYPCLINERGDGQNVPLNHAMNLYKMKDYEAAASMLSDAVSDTIADPLEGIYLGVCYLEMGKYSNAVTTFETVANLPLHLTTNQAYWYLGLTYLRLNDKEKAKDFLVRIRPDSTSYPYSRMAEEILRKLN
jgi:TolA-binding protein